MTITIIPNQIAVVTQSLMAIYSAAMKCLPAFKSENPYCTEIIIEANESTGSNHAFIVPAENPSDMKLQLFVAASAGETDLCDLIFEELQVVSEAC